MALCQALVITQREGAASQSKATFLGSNCFSLFLPFHPFNRLLDHLGMHVGERVEHFQYQILFLQSIHERLRPQNHG